MAKLCIFVFLVGVALSALIIGGHAEQFCEESGIKFKKGETISVPGECGSFTCEEPSTNLMVGQRCAEFVPKKGCHKSKVVDSKPYPDCCPREVC